MSVSNKQTLNFLNPQPVLASAGTAQRLVGSDLTVKSFTIEAPAANTGSVYIGISDASAKVGAGHDLGPGDVMTISGDLYAQGQIYLNIYDFYFDGATTGNKLVVSYLR